MHMLTTPGQIRLQTINSLNYTVKKKKKTTTNPPSFKNKTIKIYISFNLEYLGHFCRMMDPFNISVLNCIFKDHLMLLEHTM